MFDVPRKWNSLHRPLAMTSGVLRLSAELVPEKSTIRVSRNVRGKNYTAKSEWVTTKTELVTTATQWSTTKTQL